MKSVAIVSMSDSNFFHLLMELIESINSFEESKNVSICVLDAGLTENQLNLLKNCLKNIERNK